jgi:hypothetical protein
MNFLNDYKKGGSRSEKTGSMGGYTYLSKKHEQDLVLEVQKAFIKMSQNPKHPGKEKGIFVFKIVEINASGQEELDVGDIVSIMIDLQPSNDFAIEPARAEFINILAACTQTTSREYWKSLDSCEQGDVSLPAEHLEDDCAMAQGNLVHVRTPHRPNKAGWYGVKYAPVRSAAKAEKPAAKAKKG